MTTVNFISKSAAFGPKGLLQNGLTKSSSTTAAMEFKPVDSELLIKLYRKSYILIFS